MVFEITKSCKPSFIWVCYYPSCVEVIVEVVFELWVSLFCRGDCGGVWFGWYPSKCRGDCDCWSVGFEPYPSIDGLILFWLSVHPSTCRGDSCCVLPLVKRFYLLERGVMYSKVVLPKSSVEVPCVGSPVWTI